ncbi:MAG: sigma-54 interaction domain-containing protein [Bacteroidia bacterium]
MTVQEIKNRFRIIGNAVTLDRAIDIARQVAATDLSVLITGESGTGKEVFPQIIHQLSPRKHNQYIAVNCGAIPEGTIDSELFGHEKGSFTGAHEARKGYFEVANGGTIFLDEVAELPLPTQVRLLRVLESGEFIRVGSSKVMKTDVRIVAATNVNMLQFIEKGRFREDLYYRLNTVPLHIPPLRERKEDIPLLFRKFATDFADKYKMPPIKLTREGEDMLINYYWKGNVRQLKNVTEQISVIEKNRDINPSILGPYLPDGTSVSVPALFRPEQTVGSAEFTERELLYKVLFEMRKDMVDLKRTVLNLLENEEQNLSRKLPGNAQVIHKLHQDLDKSQEEPIQIQPFTNSAKPIVADTSANAEEALSLQEREKEYILKALEKHQGNRRAASKELGISERTMYRKIKDYNLE